ncbi:IS630-like element IS1066 family transposase [Bordetella petrii]|uniref:Transposase n=1 Tax=Bordetella petrii (strain ATCC BAA-461 / DSM 12804 / CCUG 43448 / CIP 107267 / Se-1111R) TaxID=340100 RepID=A9I2N3_BORPD|nr:IS630-like element IS1066 family transposase [Bordetella petrii]CAP44079.1 putative transposase [Bordetella petrii]
MARVAVALSCTAQVMAELERLSRSRSGEVRMAERARIVLACLRGKRNDEIADEMGLRPNTVGQWRRRFAQRGIAGLHDAPRSGKPPKYGVELRDRILAQLELPPPEGMASWDGGSLAMALSVSDDAVWRALRKEGIQLQRHRSWCVSTDPEFAAKAADVIGLYLNPPQNALVLSVDEKPSIQALERARGYVQTSSGKIVQGMKSTYKRHGTVNLFAALEVATGIIRGKTTQTKKRADFQAFMDEVVADQPADRQIHVILDNLSTHKKNEDWLAAHPNVTFHFTPTSASWLNQVEIWFGIFQRKTLNNASFQSTEHLVAAIHAFTAAYNENAAPFVWRKREVRGTQLRNTIVNLRN